MPRVVEIVLGKNHQPFKLVIQYQVPNPEIRYIQVTSWVGCIYVFGLCAHTLHRQKHTHTYTALIKEVHESEKAKEYWVYEKVGGLGEKKDKLGNYIKKYKNVI